MKKLRKRIELFVVNYLTRHLLKAMTEDDVLRISGKDWLWKKRKLSEEEKVMLKEEAESFRKSLLYGCLYNDLRWEAWKTMGDNAAVPEDIIFGKAMLYNQGLEKKFIKNLSEL